MNKGTTPSGAQQDNEQETEPERAWEGRGGGTSTKFAIDKMCQVKEGVCTVAARVGREKEWQLSAASGVDCAK